MFRRYAVYVTPTGDLAAFGARWLGWDIARGVAVAQPDMPHIPVERITRGPRRYGFHATIKPPFALAQGRDASGLRAAFDGLCRSLTPVALEGLQLARMGRFLALVPVGETAALNALAAQVVAGLDEFRAPPGAEELSRRNQPRLSDAQKRNLRDWGYPHVMEAFRFHMTLTGRLDPCDLQEVQTALEPKIAPALRAPVVIESLTLAGEDAEGFFHQITRVSLTGDGAARRPAGRG